MPEKIIEEDVMFGINFVNYYLPKLIREAILNVGYHQQDKFMRKIFGLIKQKGFVTVKEIYRKIHDCDSKQAEDALKILVNQGFVNVVNYQGKIQYRLVKEELENENY